MPELTMAELKGRAVVVTGASRGIGLAIARGFAEAGAWVAMVARGEAALERAAAEIGGHAIPADVASADAVHRLTAYLIERLGAVPDILVNSTGAFSLAPFAETDPSEFDRLYEVNLRAPFLMIRAFLPYMLQRGSGQIITIGSIAGRQAFPGNAAYSASKFGLRGLHAVLAEEVHGRGVRATLIEPAATDTPLWDALDPDSRGDLPSRAEMLRAEDVARGVLFAASQPAGVEVSSLAVRATY